MFSFFFDYSNSTITIFEIILAFAIIFLSFKLISWRIKK